MDLKLVAPLVIASLLLGGCQSGRGGAMMARPGGGTGGTAASAAPPSGALPGGLVGGPAGRALDDSDLAYMSRQTSKALETVPTNQTSNWVNPESKSPASVTPTRTYQRPDGTYCREFSQSVTIKGQEQKVSGTACRQADGSWQATS
ncbi:MAG TPA: RT0821/Lpp0805 family surface protein [Alphaproteobacteria bacterium]|nr:RT0821/Lpp0805 family surface protein [Alphaproteobacteria bacterium]